jgi:uncharacterized alkaline shock family protein YloU
MAHSFTTELGKIVVADEVIATAAGMAALDCYGLAGMAARRGVRDNLTGLLNLDNPGRGVEVRAQDGELQIALYVIVSYGTRIPQVADNLREKVSFTLAESFGLGVGRVDVHVVGLRLPHD